MILEKSFLKKCDSERHSLVRIKSDYVKIFLCVG
jgi:hypothetical protein